jgi:hypothetical protein
MSKVGANGIYRLYRESPEGHEKVDERLVGVFAIVGGDIHHMEDHDGILEDIVPEGRLTDHIFSRMVQLEDSPYWRLVHEDDVQDGEYPELLPEAPTSEPWPKPEAATASVTVGGEPAGKE